MMNEKERINWKQTRRLGIWRYILTIATGTALAFVVTDALIGSGYTLLIKQGDWQSYIQQLNWKKLIWQGFFVGAAIAYFYWKRKELAYKEDSDV